MRVLINIREVSMSKIIRCLLVLIHVTVSYPALATPGDFSQLLEKLKQHPEIQAYAARAEARQQYAKGELGLPDPMINMQIQDYPIGASMSSDAEERMIGFRQEIPRMAVREARSGKTKAEAQKTQLMAAYAFSSMKAKLITALATWQSLKKQEKLLNEQAGLFRSEKTSIKGRIAAHQANTSQFSLVEADSAELAITRAEIKEEKHDVSTMLINMVGETPDIAPPVMTLSAWDGNPDKTYPVKVAAEDIAMAQKEVATREAEFGPNFEVQANYGRMNNGDNAGTFMVGVSIPLWASENQRPKLAGAQAELRSSRLDQETIRRAVIKKLDHLKAQVETSNQKIELIKIKNTHLKASAKSITREYEAGKADLAMYLKTRRDALSARIALAQEHAKNVALIAEFNRYIIDGEQP